MRSQLFARKLITFITKIQLLLLDTADIYVAIRTPTFIEIFPTGHTHHVFRLVMIFRKLLIEELRKSLLPLCVSVGSASVQVTGATEIAAWSDKILVLAYPYFHHQITNYIILMMIFHQSKSAWIRSELSNSV